MLVEQAKVTVETPETAMFSAENVTVNEPPAASENPTPLTRIPFGAPVTAHSATPANPSTPFRVTSRLGLVVGVTVSALADKLTVKLP